MRLMIDTNIALDFMLVREPHYQFARKLMLLGHLHEAEIWMSGAQINDLLYVLTKGGNPKHNEAAKQSLKSLRKCVNVYALGEQEVDAVLDSNWQDLEDARLYFAAQSLKAKYIITRNRQDFELSTIKVLDAEQFFDHLATDKGLTYHELDLQRA